jgi:rifampicin phosphotransferase
VLPVRSLLGVAASIRESTELTNIFLGDSAPLEIWNRIARNSAWQSIREAIERHIAEFGERRIDELKLETPDLTDHPELLIPHLQSVLRTERDREGTKLADAAPRRAAEERLARALRRHPLRRLAIGFLVRQTRACLRRREQARLLRARRVLLERRIFRALAERLVAAKVLRSSADIYFLTLEELHGYVHATAPSLRLQEIVELRRSELAEYQEYEPAQRFETRGLVYQNLHASRPVAPLGLAQDAVLRGIGCAPGLVRGRARVFDDPSNARIEPGDILVTRSTDPGWAFLMASAAGLIVERGSILSHAAIISRELGIPTVIGVSDATRIIAEGDEVEIDGLAGHVRIRTRAQGAPAQNFA